MIADSAFKRRFIYLVEKPFSNRDAQRFGVQTVVANGFIAEVWDVGLLCSPKYPRDNRVAENVNIKIFQNFDELKCALQDLSSGDVLLGLVGMSIEQAWAYRRLRAAVFNSEATLATITNGHSPFDRWDTLWDKAKHVCSMSCSRLLRVRYGVNLIVNELKLNIGNCLTLLNQRKLDYLFAGASVMGVDRLLVGSNTKVFTIHSLDTDMLLHSESKSDSGKQQDHIVYLDSLGPLHPELQAYQLEFGLETSDFFSSNLRCLLHLQALLKKPCVVAAHPRANQGQLDEYFSPMKVFYNQTAQLVANSVCVVAEPSMSLGMAAWFDKPAIILWHDDLADWNKQMIIDFRDALGCSVWDVNDETTWETPTVDKERYEMYRNSYMKQPGSINKPFWQSVCDEVLSKALVQQIGN